MATKTKQAAKAAAPIEEMQQASDAIAVADAALSAYDNPLEANALQLRAVAIAIATKEGSIATADRLERLRTHILETMPKRVA